MILKVHDLHTTFGNTPILRDVNFTVDDGEVVGIMGRNGAGKTTLLRSIIGDVMPDSGTIRFKSKDVTKTSPHIRARMGIGYIPQGREIFPKLTVEQNLKMGESINIDNDEKMHERVFDYFPRLAERRDQRGGSMSGGEQQMLAIGRALIGNPDLLLLDEPSEGIQPSIIQQITDELTNINRELGTTILFVEQNLQVIQELASRSYVVRKGTIVKELSEEETQDKEVVSQHLAV